MPKFGQHAKDKCYVKIPTYKKKDQATNYRIRNPKKKKKLKQKSKAMKEQIKQRL